MNRQENVWIDSGRRMEFCGMLKPARRLTCPTLARQDAPCPRQGRSKQLTIVIACSLTFSRMARMSPQLRASNEGFLKPRVARAQGTHRAIPPLLTDCSSILFSGRRKGQAQKSAQTRPVQSIRQRSAPGTTAYEYHAQADVQNPIVLP